MTTLINYRTSIKITPPSFFRHLINKSLDRKNMTPMPAGDAWLESLDEFKMLKNYEDGKKEFGHII